jgi:crotonobetainyl-CoA:carnitine CoA-transferase CaiB-like acyl-CoA transferase
MMLTAQGYMSPALVGMPPVRRLAGGAELLGCLQFRFVYGCRDGHVTITLLPGVMVGPYTNRLLQWVYEQGECEEELASVNWSTLIGDRSVEEALPIIQRTIEAVNSCVARHTKAELFALARQRQFLLVPVATTTDVLANEHFTERDFWDHVDVGDLVGGTTRQIRFPGPFAHSSEIAMRRLGRPPRLGEHTDELLAVARTRQQSAPSLATNPKPATPGTRGALDGLKVVDLTWVYAGPFATRMLAYYGATVVRVESTARPDQVRSASIPRDGRGGPEDSLQWHSINADKLGLQLNLSIAEARQVVLDLAAWADVLIEGFAPGVTRRLGITPDVLRARNPGLITASTSLFSHVGPYSPIPGFGNMGAAMGGFYEVTGWPDRLPAGPYLAYTDATSPRLTAALILAALEWRRRSGKGTHLDFSQAEGGVHFLTPAVLDDEVNGRVAGRRGNADLAMAPHVVVRTAPLNVVGPDVHQAFDDSDHWLAVACETDGQWRALAALLDRPDLAQVSSGERLARRRELEDLVAAWAAARDAGKAQEMLQAAGVPAHQVQNTAECVTDPQLCHREHFVRVPHALYGYSWAEQYGFRLTRTPGGPRRAGPMWGEHNDMVLREILGYDDDRIAELAMAGALE